MNPVRQYSRPVLDAATSAQIEITWQMARESFTANGDQIVINKNVYELIGNAGLEELKIRLR